jgi:hypothetical protein
MQQSQYEGYTYNSLYNTGDRFESHVGKFIAPVAGKFSEKFADRFSCSSGNQKNTCYYKRCQNLNDSASGTNNSLCQFGGNSGKLVFVFDDRCSRLSMLPASYHTVSLR